jgi:hypothetical protein
LTSNRPVDDWGKLLGNTAAVTALLDRLLHHAHVLKWGTPQLAHHSAHGLALRGEREVELQPISGDYPWWPVLKCPSVAGFQLSTEVFPEGVASHLL